AVPGHGEAHAGFAIPRRQMEIDGGEIDERTERRGHHVLQPPELTHDLETAPKRRLDVSAEGRRLGGGAERISTKRADLADPGLLRTTRRAAPRRTGPASLKACA